MFEPRRNESSETARMVLESRYLRRDDAGNLAETADELFRRVASKVSEAEKAGEANHWRERFYEVMSRLDFLPNSPTLMNAGTAMGQLSACFVLPVEDSMDGIFDTLKLMAKVQQSGGGTGFDFSRLRPKGDRVATTGGTASGPVSFMRIFDTATENIRQGGRRRGANMGVLRIDHPDIEEFIDAKRDLQTFRNFNLSVGVTDEFMQAIQSDKPFTLLHPKTRKPVREVFAQDLLANIAEAAWETGDPGLLFLDTMNRANPTPKLGEIEATNPCGEVPLLAYEACTLGSLNLSHMALQNGEGSGIDWRKLAQTTHTAVRFLDDVVEVGQFPDERITDLVRGNRKIGLGVMGWAELLCSLGIPYASERAVALAEKIMGHISKAAEDASRELAEERGVFPNWARSVHAQSGIRVRNAARLSIAPTGTLSILAGTSASIEPLFALAYTRKNVLDGQAFLEMNPLFLNYAKDHDFYSDTLVEELKSKGSLSAMSGVPESAKRLFQTALEISSLDHLKVQAAFQRYVDNAVSKTINLPEESGPEEIAAIYEKAWEWGVKGITVFRYGCRGNQVLELGTGEAPSEHEHFSHCDPHECRL